MNRSKGGQKEGRGGERETEREGKKERGGKKAPVHTPLLPVGVVHAAFREKKESTFPPGRASATTAVTDAALMAGRRRDGAQLQIRSSHLSHFLKARSVRAFFYLVALSLFYKKYCGNGKK